LERSKPGGACENTEDVNRTRTRNKATKTDLILSK
jgi:hypothetical protein